MPDLIRLLELTCHRKLSTIVDHGPGLFIFNQNRSQAEVSAECATELGFPFLAALADLRRTLDQNRKFLAETHDQEFFERILYRNVSRENLEAFQQRAAVKWSDDHPAIVDSRVASVCAAYSKAFVINDLDIVLDLMESNEEVSSGLRTDLIKYQQWGQKPDGESSRCAELCVVVDFLAAVYSYFQSYESFIFPNGAQAGTLMTVDFFSTVFE